MAAALNLRRHLWPLLVAAVLLPAVGIAYLGAAAYGDERGAVAARLRTQARVAAQLAEAVRQALTEALRRVEAGADGDGLARHGFVIGADGALRRPDPAALGPRQVWPAAGPARPSAACTERDLEACIREVRSQEQRARALLRARHAELACVAGRGGERALDAVACARALAAARADYERLAAHRDTGAEALLGLARMARGAGDLVGAGGHLDRLLSEHPSARVDGEPVALWVALARAELDDGAGASLTTLAALLDGSLGASAAATSAGITRVRAGLARRTLGPAAAERVRTLDGVEAAAERAARAAAGLAGEVDELVRTAGADVTARVARAHPGRILVYRRSADGGVVGVAVDASMLEAALPRSGLVEVAPTASARVWPVGQAAPPALRLLAQVGLGPTVPMLTVSVLNPMTEPDPLDDVIRGRARRHVVLTSALAVVLLAGLVATVRGATRERELARLKSDFVSTVSHELKTPLTSIRMFAEMLEQGLADGDPGRAGRYHNVIVRESQRLGLLIGNLLDYAQVERGTRRYQPERAALGELVNAAVETFRSLDAEGGGAAVTVEFDAGAAEAEIEVDRDVLVSALLNLLGNAGKYGGGQPIVVRAGAGADQVALAVIDRGPGIAPSEHVRIFREFYRSPAAYRSGAPGTGLGLALVKRHVEALGGAIAVSSQVGAGATFTITLPRARPRGPTAPVDPAPASEAA